MQDADGLAEVATVYVKYRKRRGLACVERSLFDGPSKDEKDHYDIFLGLQSGTETWNTFHVIQNPTSTKYFDPDKKIYAVRII
jgi:hypothetical protein